MLAVRTKLYSTLFRTRRLFQRAEHWFQKILQVIEFLNSSIVHLSMGFLFSDVVKANT